MSRVSCLLTALCIVLTEIIIESEFLSTETVEMDAYFNDCKV